MKTASGSIKEVALLFLKLGCIAFGGPAAHIAIMEDEVVHKRRWMSRQHFLDLVGATNLIPGPNSTEMTMHCGHERAGHMGLFVAGACFIFPAVVITGVFAWLYVQYGSLPTVEPFIYGIKPAVLAIIAGAIMKLGKKAVKGWELAVLGFITFVVSVAGVNEIAALLGAGIIGCLYFFLRNSITGSANLLFPFPAAIAAASITKLSAFNVFWPFLKVGLVLYGSGYVLFAYLDAELVEKGWLTRQQLMDAVGVGQFTPGPVLSTATFIGYQLNGIAGAVAATLGIFLPSFFFVLFLNPLIPKMRRSRILSYFLDSVNIAAVAVMCAVLLEMGKDTLINWRSVVIAILSIGATIGLKKVNAVWLVAGGSIAGRLLLLV